MPLVYNEQKGVWEFGEDPKFKTQAQAQQYQSQKDASLESSIASSMGVGPSQLSELARQSGTKKALEEEGYAYDDMFETPEYTPGGISTGYEAPEIRGEAAANYQKDAKELGYNPGIGADTQDLLAEDQTALSKITNGVIKWAGKTTTNVAGSIIGTAYGIGSAIANRSFTSFYDNDFQRALDGANEAMDEYLPNYVRREVEDYSLLEQMGTLNFWANDMLGGMSFVAGAVISEYLTAGMASAMIVPRAAKALKYTDRAADALKGYQAAAFGTKTAIGVNSKTLQELGKFSRQMAVGSFYEAGVEARHFVDESKRNYIEDFRNKEGRDPLPEEMSAFMDNAHNVGNALFAANAALVSLNNMITLPNSFGPGLTKRFGAGASHKAANEAAFSKGIFGTMETNVIPTKSLTPKQLKNASKNLGVSMDEVKAMNVVSRKAIRGTTKTDKVLNTLRTAGRRTESAFAEGVWEEGMQGALSGGALEYVTNYYDPEAKDTSVGVMSAFAQGMEETYGTKEGLKEVVIGAILGLTGFAGPGGWQGGIYGSYKADKSNQQQVDRLVDTVNRSKDFGNIFKGMYLAGQQRLVASQKMDKAAELNDMFKYKSAENDAFVGYVLGRTEAGMYDAIEGDIVKTVSSMTNDEFAEEFGYENMTDEELTQRKNEAISQTKTRAKQIRDGLLTSKNITNSDNIALNHGLAWTISTLDNIDAREESLANLAIKYSGKLINNSDLQKYIQLGLALDDTKFIKEYQRIIGEIDEKNLRRETLINGEAKFAGYSTLWAGREQTLIKDRQKIDRLEKEIIDLEKQRKQVAKEMLDMLKKGSSLEYNNDVDAFGQDMEIFMDVKDQINLQAKRPTFKDNSGQNPKTVYEDLKKLAKYREQVISEYNMFLSEKGREDFVKSIDNINKLIEKDRISEEFQIAVATTPITEETKVKEIQEAAFMIRGNMFVTHAVKQEPGIVQNNQALNSLNKTVQNSNASAQFKSWLEQFNKEYTDLIETEVSISELIKYLEEKLKEAKRFAESFKGTQEGDNYKELVNSNQLQTIIDNLKEQLKATNQPAPKKGKGFVPIIVKASQLFTVKPDLQNPDAVKILKSLTKDKIQNFEGITIELVNDSEGGKIVNPTDEKNQEVTSQGVKIRKGYNGKQQQLAVKYEGTIIGYIYDPNRYQFDDGSGGLRNFNGTAEDLERLNPDFVMIDNGALVPSGLGTEFINTYNALQNFWTVADKAFENNLTLPSEFLSNFLFPNLSLNYTTGTIESLESLSSNPNLQIKDKNGNTTRPIIYRSYDQSIFLYSEESGNYEKVADDDYNFYYDTYVEPNRNKIDHVITNQYILIGNNEETINTIGLTYPDRPVEDTIKETILDTYSDFETSVKNANTTNKDELDIFPVETGFIALKDNVKLRINLLFSKYNSTYQKDKDSVVTAYPRLVIQVYNPNATSEKDKTIYINMPSIYENKTKIKAPHIQVDPKTNLIIFNSEDSSVKPKIIQSNEELAEAISKVVSFYFTESVEISSFQQSAEIKETNEEGKTSIVGLEMDNLQARIDMLASLNFRPKSLSAAASKPKPSASSKTINLVSDITDTVNSINTDTAADKDKAKDLKKRIEEEIKKDPSLATPLQKYIPYLQKYIDKEFTPMSPSMFTNADESEELSSELTDINKQIDEKKTQREKIIEKIRNDNKGNNPAIVKARKSNTELQSLGTEIEQLEERKANIISKILPAFKIEENPSEDNIDLEEAFTNLQRMLPPNVITFREFETIKRNLKNKGQISGAFFKKVIYLARNASKGVEYHEAFHAVVRTFLTDAELNLLFKEAKVRYGKPSSIQLKKLKNQAPKNQNLNDRQLELLWYEEKMADEFQSYAVKKDKEYTGVKGLIKRFFDKLKALANWVTNNKADIDSLFDSIYHGNFKASKETGAFPIYYGADTEVYKLIPKRKLGYLDSTTSLRVYNRVLKEVFKIKEEQGIITDDSIQEALYNVVDTYYNVDSDNFIYGDILADIDASKATKVELEIKEIQNSLVFLSDKASIEFAKEIRRRLESIQFEDDPDGLEYQEDDTPMDLAIKDNRTLGGLGSTSKQMREYMSLMEMPVDEFNIGLTEAQLASGQFNSYIDPNELYTSVEAIMTNTRREDMLKKLAFQARSNPKVQNFFNVLMQDIKTELRMLNASNEDIANMPSSVLFKSNKYNLFIANFNKYKSNQITTLADPSNGLFKVFRTNMYDVQEKQISEWAKNWRIKDFDENKNAAKKTLEELKRSLKDYSKMLSPEEKPAYIAKVQGLFDSLGISLSKNYIEYVLLDIAIQKGKYEEVYLNSSPELKQYLDEIKDSYDLFIGVEVFGEDDIQGIMDSLNTGSPFLVDSTITAFDEMEDLEDVNNAKSVTAGAVGRLKNMALGNSYFDESVGSTVVQNADGETQYTHLAPNYFLIQTLAFQDKNFRAWINAENREDGITMLKDVLQQFGKSFSDYQIESFYDAVKSNPLLHSMITSTNSTAIEEDNSKVTNIIFQNFKLFFNDGLRNKSLKSIESADGGAQVVAENYKESSGSVYADLDARATLYTMMTYFVDNSQNTFNKKATIPGGKEVRFVPFIPLHIEAKNTQVAVSMPVSKLTTTENGLNNAGADIAFIHFMQEYERIRKITKEIKEDSNRDIVKGYNTKIGDRGTDFFNFKFLKNTNPRLYDKLLEDARSNSELSLSKQEVKDLIKESFNSQLEEFVELLKSEKLVYEGKEGETKVNILPMFYRSEGNTLNMNNIAEFFFNSSMNSLNYNNLMFGDIAYNFKNPIDFVKRMAGPNSAGPAIGYGESKVAILDDVYNAKGTETTNAQGYSNPFWYTRTYLPALGKNTSAVKRIYDRVIKGYPLTREEISILKDQGALGNPRKIAFFDTFLYGKTSIKLLIREETSEFKGNSRDRAYVDSLYDNLKNLDQSSDEFKATIREIHKFWKPIRGREKLHNRLNKMELEDVPFVIHSSAIKGAITNLNANEEGEYQTTVINNQFVREQVSTDSMKDKIVHGTQLMQLISSEHKDDTTVIFKGKNTTIGDLRKFYRKLLGDRVIDSFRMMREAILDQDIPKYKYLLDSFRGSILESGGDPLLMEMFSSAYQAADMPEYNLNLPSIEQKFENMFLAFMSKGVLSQKVPGHKFTLVSDDGYEIYRNKEGKPFTSKEASLISPSNLGEPSRLQYHKKDDSKNVYYAECMISAQLATELGLKPGDEIPPYMLELVGVRIPTQDKHSMVFLKVVDILPGVTGNQIVMPADILDLSGADFDIDSEFVRTADFYRDENGKIRVYGDYLESKNPNAVAFQEFINSTKKQDKRIKKDIKDFESQNEDYIKLVNEKATLQNSLKKLEDEVGVSLLASDLSDADLEEFLDDEEGLDALLSEYEAQRNERISEQQKEILKKIKTLNKSIKKVKKEILLAVLGKNGYPNTQEDFDYKYGKQIKENIEAFNKGNITNITPLTIGEGNNMTLEIEKSLIYNEGNADIATSPADDKLGQEFMKKNYNTEEEDASNKFNNPSSISTIFTPTDIVKANSANSIGKDNVGIAAIWNVAYAYLRQNTIGLRKKFADDRSLVLNAMGFDNAVKTILNYSFDTDYTRDTTETRNSVRIVHINSTQITFAVDNAKFQYAAYFNLSTNTLGPVLLMTGKGMSFDRAMLINIQPAVLEYEKRAKVVGGQLKTEAEKSFTKTDAIISIANEYSEELKKIKPEGAGNVELTPQNLIQAKLFEEDKPSTLQRWQYLEIQLQSLMAIEAATKESETIKELGNVLSLIKGSKTDFIEMNGITESLKKLGIEVVAKSGTKGLDPSNYEIKHTKDFNDLDIPYDLLPILKGDGLVSSNLKTFAAIMKISEMFVITQTEFALKTFDRVKLSFKERKGNSVLNYTDNAKALKNQFIAFLSAKAYGHKKGKKFSYDTLFAEPGKLTRLSELMRAAYSNQELKNNKFIKYLTAELTDYTTKENSMFYGKKLQKFSGQSRIKKSPDYKRELMNAFTELTNGNFSSTETQDIAKNLSVELREYLFVKDGLLFKNKSFISEIGPEHFKLVSESLFSVQDVLSGKKSFEEVFGKSKEELESEFVEKFSRYQGNVFNLISNSYMNIIGNMRAIKEDVIREVFDKALDSQMDGSDMTASEMIKALKAIKEEEALDVINKDLMPLTIDSNTGILTFNIFAGTKPTDIFDIEGSKSKNTAIMKANFKAILSTGLVKPITVLDSTTNKTSNRIGYPEFISINSRQGRQVYKLTKVVKPKNDKTLKTTSSYEFGSQATYVPVATIGTKEVLPYAIDLDEHDAYIVQAEITRNSKNKKEVKEEADENAPDFFKAAREASSAKEPSVPTKDSSSSPIKNVLGSSKSTISKIPDEFKPKVTFTDDADPEEMC